MPLVLILPRTPADAAPSYEYVLYSGSTSQQHARAPISLIPSAPEIDLLVPSMALSWHRVRIPASLLKDRSRTRQTVEGTLEDRLLDDPANLHFAVSSQPTEDGTFWVGVCEADWLAGHLRGLEAAGRRVGRIIPEAAPSDGPPTAHVTGSDQGAWLIVVNPDESSGCLTVPLTPDSSLPASAVNDRPEPIPVSAESDLVSLAEATFGRPVAPVSRGQYLISRLETDWDLAQFRFATTGKARLAKSLEQFAHALVHAPRWRAARWGMLVLLASQVLGLNIWAWNERRQQQIARDSLVETAQRTFPTLKLVVDAPAQMQRELAQLRQRAGVPGPLDFEVLVATLGDSLAANARISQLEYDGQGLRVQVIGMEGPGREELVAGLQAKGYTATSEGERLVLREGAAR